MSFFGGMSEEASRSPKLGAGVYSDVEILGCKVHQGTPQSGGVRYIVDVKVLAGAQSIDTTGYEKIGKVPSALGSIASFAVRLDDTFGYGKKDVARMIDAAYLGNVPGDVKEIADATLADATNPLKGLRIAIQAQPARSKAGNEFLKFFFSAATASGAPALEAPAAPPPVTQLDPETALADAGWVRNPAAEEWCYNAKDGALAQTLTVDLLAQFGA